MELVGGVASIITLIEATGVLAKVSRDLVLRWRDAPHEIQALATRLSLLAAELQSIKNATARSHPVLTDAIIRQSLSDQLTDVRKRLAKLESLHFHLQPHGAIRQKVEWVAKASSVEKMLSKTQEVEQRLANLMTLISLRAQTPILESLDRIEQMVSTLVIALPASALAVPATPPVMAAAPGNITSYAGSGAAVRGTLISTLAKSWASWGLRGSLITSQKGPNNEYNINFSVSLPLARILGGYAFIGCLSLESMPLFGTALMFRHPSYFAVARVVDDCHPFMTACEQDDVDTVRLMLRNGEGRPTDMTAKGRTPMQYAVWSKGTKVIAELLDCGVDVNAVIDPLNMINALTCSSALKYLDIVRFLLQRGASAGRVDGTGFGAETWCWVVDDDLTRGSSMDVFNLFLESTHLELDHSRLYFAASSARGVQIDALVRLGADVHHKETSGSAAIHYAAWHGNYSTYLALASYYDGNIFKNDKEFGSLLLFRAIRGRKDGVDGKLHHPPGGGRCLKHDEVLIDMFQRGVEPRMKLPVMDDSESRYGWGPPDVNEYKMEADKLAAALGQETEAWYLSVLRSCGLLVHRDYQRLRQLAEAGHVAAGFVYVDEEEPKERDYRVRGDREEDGDVLGLGQEDIYTDIDEVSRRSSISEADEANQFWDAEEIL